MPTADGRDQREVKLLLTVEESLFVMAALQKRIEGIRVSSGADADVAVFQRLLKRLEIASALGRPVVHSREAEEAAD